MANSLDEAFKKINKMYGANTVMVLGENKPPEINTISTGSLLIDQIMGGGVAKGRICEIYGVESSGKSTLALQVVAQAQKEGKSVVYIDSEQAVDLNYAKKLGVDVDKLIFTQPSSAEQCLDIACQFAECKEVGLIVIDSIGSLAPQAELDGEMGDVTVGLVARLLSKFCRKITATLNETQCALICINQLRDKISTGWSAGPSETTTGGRALKFFASQRVELRKATAIKEKETVIGNNVKIKVVKNKICPPMKVAMCEMIFGKGFSSEEEVINLALEYELITKAGAWFTTHNGERMCGKTAVKEYYDSHPELAKELRDKVVSLLKSNGEAVIVDEYVVDSKTGEIVS